jgi:voltage-gated potassium channel
VFEMTPQRAVLLERLRVPLALLAITHVVGAAGYWWLWHERGGTWLDALFMTFITITTIGFGEVHPLGTGGRLLTMGIAASGIGSLFYTFTVVLDYLGSDDVRVARRRRKMQQRIAAMADHFVLAGIGRVGREAAAELLASGAKFVVVDPSPEISKWCGEWGCPFVQGDATEDAVLKACGIERARGLIVTTSSDATNLYVILTARLLNAGLFIASRAVDDASVPKLIRAGANRAISPYAIGGRRLAHLLLSPRVVDFLETAMLKGEKSLSIEDVLVAPGSVAEKRPLESLEIGKTGASVLAIVRDGVPTPNPRADVTLAVGDHLLVLGTSDQLSAVEQAIGRKR